MPQMLISVCITNKTLSSEERCQLLVVVADGKLDLLACVLKKCNYPAWSICKARKDIQDKSEKTRKLARKRAINGHSAVHQRFK